MAALGVRSLAGAVEFGASYGWRVTASYSGDIAASLSQSQVKPADQRPRWGYTLGYAFAMLGVYLFQPVSFLAAMTASSAVACLYVTAISWRRSNVSRGAPRSEPLTSVGAADPPLVPTRRSRFWREFLPIYVS